MEAGNVVETAPTNQSCEQCAEQLLCALPLWPPLLGPGV